MNNDNTLAAIFMAARLAGMVERLSPADFAAAAETPGLKPEYAAVLRAVAEFRAKLEWLSEGRPT